MSLDVNQNDNLVNTNQATDTGQIDMPYLEEDVTKLANNIIANIKDIDEDSASLMAQTQALNNREQNRVLQAQMKKLDNDAIRRENELRKQQERLADSQYLQAIVKDINKTIPDITKADDFINKLQDDGFMQDIAAAGKYSAFKNAVNNKDAKETVEILKSIHKSKTDEQMNVAEIGGGSAANAKLNSTPTTAPKDIKRAAQDLQAKLTKDGKLDIKAYKEQFLDMFFPRNQP